MKHLNSVAGIIEAAGIARVGIDLFIGTIPADVSSGIMLRDPLVGATIDKGMKNFYSFEFQVIVRDPDVAQGYVRAEQIQSVLDITDWEDADIHISWMQPCNLPVSYPRGDSDTMETSFRVSIGFGRKV